jgi:UTP--glucose-1-phosphate uridylyltransferase
MMALYEETEGGNVVAVAEVPREPVQQYGIVAPGEAKGAGFRITGMVEKPKPDDAPSNYMISGRYILQPDIFALLAEQSAGAGGEIQVTDAMLTLLGQQPFWAYPFPGRIYDCGAKLGFLTANAALGLADPALGPAFRAALKELLG